jgi:hypothetical protein
MAKGQSSLFTGLRGKIGGGKTVYTNRKGETIVSTISTAVNKQRILTSPEFERTRENMGDFGASGKLASLIKRMTNPILRFSSDNQAFQRIVKALRLSKNNDTANARGEREADLSDIIGLQYNVKSAVATSFFKDAEVSASISDGTVTVTIPEHKPNFDIAMSKGATHAKFEANVVYMTEDGVGTAGTVETAAIELASSNQAQLTLKLEGVPNGATDVIVNYGIRYYKMEANEQLFDLRNSSYNCAKILDVLSL